jgi:hypothetical protein
MGDIQYIWVNTIKNAVLTEEQTGNYRGLEPTVEDAVEFIHDWKATYAPADHQRWDHIELWEVSIPEDGMTAEEALVYEVGPNGLEEEINGE